MTQRLIMCQVPLVTTFLMTLLAKNQLAISHRDEENKSKPKPSSTYYPGTDHHSCSPEACGWK